jgi:D-alanine transaminase
MEISYLNGKFLPKDHVKISPDDRGFLFADGVYEVVRWYAGIFYDMNGHVARLKKSLEMLGINWPDSYSFPGLARELIKLNNFDTSQATVYLQVTRGEAPRTHYFPSPPVPPTVYSFARKFDPDTSINDTGVRVMLKKEIRWSRCNIKTIALLPNTMSYQEAKEKGYHECIFVRDGFITEGTHSNIFFVKDNTLITYPESEFILSGITRKNILRIARKSGLQVREEPLHENETGDLSEAFISSTAEEATPVVYINDKKVGNGLPGPVTGMLREKFLAEIRH